MSYNTNTVSFHERVRPKRSPLQEQNYTPEADDRERIIEELIAKLCIQPKEMTLRAPVTDFRLLSSETRGRIVTLNFSPEYYDLSAVEEVLTRTAIVNTMCSFSEIDGVYFLVDGKKLHDADGEEPGIMEPDQFIYNSYMEMRNYERVRLHLYFANESGDRLVDAYRTVVYNSNMPLERIVLDLCPLYSESVDMHPLLVHHAQVLWKHAEEQLLMVVVIVYLIMLGQAILFFIGGAETKMGHRSTWQSMLDITMVNIGR